MERVFLIGGYDLEMVEILKILEENREKYIDKKLSWGAKLSDYKEKILEIDEKCVIYALELEKDIEFGKNIISLDHHNEFSAKDSTLEQVAEILNIELTRRQKLIVENDKGYIPAMEKYGATKKEICAIRKEDRKCQGVTEEDEKLAEKSILENRKVCNGITIVKSAGQKFSPICDRLYPVNNLIVYTDDELNYYGKFSKELYEKYENSYKVYSGGGENGYLLFKKKKLEIEEIKNIIEEIVKYVKSN